MRFEKKSRCGVNKEREGEQREEGIRETEKKMEGQAVRRRNRNRRRRGVYFKSVKSSRP